jgi:hypothetical protein
MIKNMAKEYSVGLMEDSIKGNGKTGSSMG